MKMVKSVTLILLAFLFVQLQAQNVEGDIIKKEEKKIIIIKKTIDEDGNEVTEKIVKEGTDADNVFFIDDNGKKMEINIETLEGMDGETIKWKSEDGKDMKVIKRSQTIEVDDEGEHKSIRIQMDGDGDMDVFKWDGEGDIPDDIKKELKAKGIELEEMGESIRIKKGGKTSMIMSNPNQAFLGVMMAHKEEIKNENGVETSTTEDSATVVGIVPNSAAAEAGLQENDVITAINDTPINSHQDVVTALTNHVAGEEITVAYTRDGQPATTKATLKGAAEFENIGMGEDENTNVEVSVEEDANGNVTTTTITTVTKNGKETVKKKIEKTTKEDKKN